MPLYEYFCDECGETIEALQKMTDQPLIQHQVCKASGGYYCGGRLVLLPSVVTFRFKGSGFYATDYKSNKP